MKALSTLYREYKEKNSPHRYVMVFLNALEELERKRYNDRQRGLFLEILRILHKGGGYLIDMYEQPYTHDSLEKKLDRKNVKGDLDKLIRGDVLAMTEDGTIYYPLMAAVIEGRAKEKGNQAESRRVRKSLEEVVKCNDDIVTTSQGEPQKSPTQLSKVKESKEGSTHSVPTFSYSTTVTEQDQGDVAESLALPTPFPGLSLTDLETVKSENPDKDFAAVYKKFVDWHTKEGTLKATKVMLAGWFRNEKASTKCSSTKPQASGFGKAVKTIGAKLEWKRVKNPDYDRVRDDPDEKYITLPHLGDRELPDELRWRMEELPPSNEAEAVQWLIKVAGMPWNAMDALHTYSSNLVPEEQWMFMKYDEGDNEAPEEFRGKWVGLRYEDPEEIADAEEKQKEAAEATAENARIKAEYEARVAEEIRNGRQLRVNWLAGNINGEVSYSSLDRMYNSNGWTLRAVEGDIEAAVAAGTILVLERSGQKRIVSQEGHRNDIMRKVSKVIQGSWLWESEEHIAGALKESAMGPKFNREKFIEAFSRLADFSTGGAIGAANKITEFVEWTEPEQVAA
jgi:hypothetical protein